MTIDKIKEILVPEVYQFWMDCRDLQKIQASLKTLNVFFSITACSSVGRSLICKVNFI